MSNTLEFQCGTPVRISYTTPGLYRFLPTGGAGKSRLVQYLKTLRSSEYFGFTYSDFPAVSKEYVTSVISTAKLVIFDRYDMYQELFPVEDLERFCKDREVIIIIDTKLEGIVSYDADIVWTKRGVDIICDIRF